ncbi:MAG: hypothetical protein F9K18_03470 [Thermoanaerobaculia bacterium]|nr:MAG: hypothetical protein F9K18_03470 [Thermoanaerobaculia bacterium]
MSWVQAVVWLATFFSGALAALLLGDRVKRSLAPESRLRRRALKAGLPRSVVQLPTEQLELAISRPPLWEYRLFQVALHAALSENASIAAELRFGLPKQKVQTLAPSETIDWLKRKWAEFMEFEPALQLAGSDLQVAFGQPGEPGDSELLVRVAKDFAAIHRRAIEWAISFREMHLPDDLRTLAACTSKASAVFTSAIEELDERTWFQLEKMLARSESEREELVVKITIVVASPYSQELAAELERATKLFERDPETW